MNKIIFALLVLLALNSVHSQSWRQYNLQTGQVTIIPFTYTSNSNSDLKNGSKGILPDNYSNDTSRSFFPIDIINDPNAYPWRTTVKFNDVTGILIDPYHVLTAGHAIEFHPYFQTVKFVPGFENYEEPYGYAYAEYFYLLSNYSPGTSRDYAIIKLDRPIGALSGWNGYGYNNDDSFFMNSIFNNTSYPSQTPYSGIYQYDWKGYFNSIGPEYMLSTRIGAGGMSGSPAFTKINDINIVYGIITNLGIKFNRITAPKFDAINSIVDLNTPVQFDLIPLRVDVSPKYIKTGTTLESLNLILHNYSSENKINANVTVKVYLSSDQVISESDDLIATYNYQNDYPSKSSQFIQQTNSLPVINKPAGNYWIGVIISGDNNTNNNTTKTTDIVPINITNSELATIKGRLTSATANSGINGVMLTGFPNSTKTDFNGYYETQVITGWSGTVTPFKNGFDFTNSSTTYTNVTQNTTTNYAGVKKTYTISGIIISPIAQAPVSNVRLSGLVSEPVTDVNGSYSVNVFHGYSSTIYPVKGSNWNFQPFSGSASNVTSGKTANFSGGFYITGRCYENSGIPIANVLLDGFPNTVQSDIYGDFNVFLDSGWTGTVVPVKDDKIFSPNERNYDNLIYSLEGQNFIEQRAVTLNIKVLLSGAMYENSDTMRTVLNYKNYLPVVPPDTLSGSGSPFIYKRKPGDQVTNKFFQAHRDIVDWVIIELRENKDLNSPVDTMAAFIRKDGKILSLTGDTVITLGAQIIPDNYYVIIRHRNHIAIMSANPTFLSSSSELLDFTESNYVYLGFDAALLNNGKYGMYPGDADKNGAINISDYQLFQNSSVFAETGYLGSDFNLDGLLTGSDFNIFAPVNKKRTTTNVPISTLMKFLKAGK
jgi:hypothetical protein